MNIWKIPPKIKIYEALGALSDDRVEIIDEAHARVWSSDRSKQYDVFYDVNLKGIIANDNGSYWQGYLGYPSIAFLMAQNKLPCDRKVTEMLSAREWKKLNVANNNDYEKTITLILSILNKKQREEILNHVEEIMKAIIEQEWLKLPRKKQPPK